MCHCLPKHFWWPYCYYYAMTLNWELITRDQIILPSLAHSSSPRKLSQLPQQMLSHQWEWSTPHFGMHIIYPGTFLSTRQMLSGSRSCCEKNMGQKCMGPKFSQLTPSFVQLCFVQKPTLHSSISFNFTRSGPLCEQLSACLTSTGTVLWFGRKDSNQHKNVLHIHRPHSVNA